MSTATAQRNVPLDAPPDLPHPRDLGRIVRYEETCRRYGPDLVAKLTEYVGVGDELAYELLLTIRERDGFGWPDLHHALEDGLPDDAPDTAKALFEQAEQVPDWVDWEQLRRGAIAFWRHGPIVMMALTSSLGRGFKAYAGMKPTIFTGRLIDEARVGRRLVETLRYIAAVTTPDAMRRDGDGWKFTVRLRMLHQSVRHGCSHAEAWDWKDWGLPVNATDNLTPELEFSVGLIDMLRQAGVEFDARERDDIVALWRYVGYVLGTPEEILPTSEHDARRKLAIIDSLNHPPDDTNRMMLHSLVGYASLHGIGYDPFPDWVARWLTPERRKELVYGLMYAWSGEEIAAQMEIPRNPYRHTLRLIKPAMRLRARMTRRSPEADERACRRMLEEFKAVTDVDRGEAPLADPDEIANEIRKRRQRLRQIFSRG
mgnify:CR=1 FL=1